MQTKKIWKFAVGFILLTGVPAVQAQTGFLQTVGEAYDLGTDKLMYKEKHCVSAENDARQVTYEDSNGKMIAHKIVDYQSGMTTPSFIQNNVYARQSLKVEMIEQQLIMSVLDADNQPVDVASTAIDADLPVVIDAGFDYFIRDHWDSLVNGKTQEFQFPLATRSSLVELRIGPTTCSYDGSNDQCFKLDVNSWVLRMFVKSIELGYDAELKRLTRYRGLSNIEDENGKGMVVDIRYDYSQSEQQSCAIEHRYGLVADDRLVSISMIAEQI